MTRTRIKIHDRIQTIAKRRIVVQKVASKLQLTKGIEERGKRGRIRHQVKRLIHIPAIKLRITKDLVM